MFKISKTSNQSGRALSFSLAFALVLTGCSHLGTRNQSGKDGSGGPISEVSKGTPPAEGYTPKPGYGKVDLPVNPAVQKWIDYFTGRGRKYMGQYLERSSRYIPMMKGVFRERGMPDELAYVSMIESGFSATAYSSASAVGYWQFIRETGKRYNLRIDPYVDERRDPILSTQAAANYLDSLYSLFGDWSLSLAAYNSGENRIQSAVMKRRTRDYWELASQRRALPRETANYVPKFVAAVYIASNPEKYGFTNIDFHPEFEFESVVIEKPISLELLAQNMGVSYEELKRMNPRYKSDFVPVYQDRQNAVRVPVGRSQEALAMLEKSYAAAPTRYIATFEYYKIRHGDTLSGIARKFRTTVSRIRDMNDFNGKRTMIRVGQKIKIPEGPGAFVANSKSSRAERQTQKQRRVASAAVSSAANTMDGKQIHVVQKGDNLTTISQKYGISIDRLLKMNQLRKRSLLRVGDRIVVSNRNTSSSIQHDQKRGRRIIARK